MKGRLLNENSFKKLSAEEYSKKKKLKGKLDK